MPQVQITASASVKEEQSDANPAAIWQIAFKDNFVDEYDGVKRVFVLKGSTKVIDVRHLTTLRTVSIENITPNTTFRLRLRSRDVDGTELEIGRFFLVDVRNVEQIKILNTGDVDITLRVFLAGEPSEVA